MLRFISRGPPSGPDVYVTVPKSASGALVPHTVALSVHRRGSNTDNVVLLVRRRAGDVQVFTLRDRPMGFYAFCTVLMPVALQYKGPSHPFHCPQVRPTYISTHTTALNVRRWAPIPISSPNKSTTWNLCVIAPRCMNI